MKFVFTATLLATYIVAKDIQAITEALTQEMSQSLFQRHPNNMTILNEHCADPEYPESICSSMKENFYWRDDDVVTCWWSLKDNGCLSYCGTNPPCPTK